MLVGGHLDVLGHDPVLFFDEQHQALRGARHMLLKQGFGADGSHDIGVSQRVVPAVRDNHRYTSFLIAGHGDRPPRHRFHHTLGLNT